MRKLNRKIKILHIIGTFLRGGTERLMLDILSLLDREIFDITACAYGNHQIPSVVQEYREAGINTIIFPQEAGRGLTGLRLVLALRRYIRQNRFDIVHTHHYQANMYCRPAAILACSPVVMTYEHNWPGRERSRHRLMFRFLNLWTHRNIVISGFIRRYYLDQVGVSADKVITIYNGINTTLFQPGTDDEIMETRKRIEVPADAVVVGTVGRLVDWKRVDFLIGASAEILRVHSNTYFLIAGDGEMREQWMLLAQKLGVGDRVRFLGWYADMHSLYRAMDIFCMTSESGGSRFSGEGFGLVSVEAMASGLPIMAVDNAINREVITKACGLFCESTSEDVARRVCQLIDDTELRDRLRQAGRRRAKEHFDIECTVQRLSDVYQQAMQHRGGQN